MRFTRYILFLVALGLLASCEVGRVAPNAGDLSKAQDSDNLVTDDEFAPRVVNITPFQYCTLSEESGVVNEKSDCDDYDKVNTRTYFNRSGLRFLFEFNKPVHFTSATQGQLQLLNAEFAEGGSEGFKFQPVEVVESTGSDGEKQLGFEEVVNPEEGGKYRYYTTKQYVGAIKPVKPQDSVDDQGTFTIGFPANLVYDTNPNGKKIYNTAGNRTFNYDNVPPKPKLTFSISEMNGSAPVMSSSADDLEGRGLDFSTFKLTLEWGETVTPVTNINKQLESNDRIDDNDSSRLFEVVCRNCTDGTPYAAGRAVGSDSLNNPTSGVRSAGSNAPTNSEYHFTFIEDDRTGDLLRKLTTATRVTLRVNPRRFADLAGNVSTTIVDHVLEVDNTRPSVNFINLSTSGEREASNNRILGIGDTVDLNVEFYGEKVTIPDYDEYAIELILGGNDRLKAKLIPDQQELRGEYRSTWQFRYTVSEGDGANSVGVNAVGENELDIPGQQYSGDNTKSDGSVESNWESDFSLLLSATSNQAYDRVLWPIDEFTNNSLYDGTNDRNQTLFREDSGRKLNNLHVDGVRPAVVADSIDNLSQLLSGSDQSIGKLTTTVSRGGRLVIAIPFSETLRNSLATGGINFASMGTSNPLRNASVAVTYCSNVAVDANDCQKVESHTFNYSQTMTQKARETAALSPFRYRTLVFAREITTSLSGVRSLIVGNLTYASDSDTLPISDFNDHAGNSFDSEDTVTTSSSQGLKIREENSDTDGVVVNIGIEGGTFAITDINLIDRNSQGQNISVPDGSTTTYSYNQAKRALYIEAVANRDFLRNPVGDDGQLVIGIDDPNGNKVELASSSVSIKLGTDNNPVRNTLLFYFDLSSDNYSDYNGITFERFVQNDEDKFKDELSIALSSDLSGASISPVFTSRIEIDTDPPNCNSIYITDKANGDAPSGLVRFGTIPAYSDTLYLAIDCDQDLVYHHYDDDPYSDVKPFMPVSFDTLDFIMEYDRVVAATDILLFNFKVRPGLPGSGVMHMGANGIKTANWHVVNGSRVGDLPSDHQFLTDAADNPLDLNSLTLIDNKYLLQRNIVQTGGASNTDILVDTRPYAIEIRWPVPSTDLSPDYFQADGATWISGSSPTNRLGFAVRYGYYLDDVTKDSAISLPVQADVSGDYQQPDDTAIFGFTPESAEGAWVNYSGRLANDGSIADVTIDHISSTLTDYTTDSAPFESHNVTVVNANGEALDQPVIVNSPVNPSLLYLPEGYGASVSVSANTSFPSLKASNTRPQLNSVDVYVDLTGDGASYQKLDTGSHNGETYFGDIYLLARFDKSMSEEDTGEIYPHLFTTDDMDDDHTVDAEDLIARKKSDLTGNIQTLVNGLSNPEQLLVYVFSYAREKYKGKGLTVNPGGGSAFFKEKSSGALDDLRDSYGNPYLATALTATGYDLTMDARSDITEAEFIDSPYKHGDTITYRIKTKSRINVTRVTSGKALAQKLRLDTNENSSDGAQEIWARALSSAITSETTSDTDGSTTITFTYSLSNLEDQYNADTTADFGLQPTGLVQFCDVDGQGVKNCGNFSTKNLTASGVDGTPAILTLENPGNYRAQVASQLNRLVMTDTGKSGLVDSGVFNAMQIVDGGALRDFSADISADILEQDEKLVFVLPVNMLDETFGTTTPATNSLQNASTSQLLFSLYNGVSQQRVTRLADYTDDTSGKLLRFTYTIQAGDLVHIKDASSGDAVDYESSGGTISKGADLALRVDTSAMFNGATGNKLNGLADMLIGNPVWSQVMDDSNNVRNVTLDITTDGLTIDTRPRLVSARAATPTVARSGVVTPILLTFSQQVYGNSAYAILTDGTTDVTADLTQESVSDNKDLPFSFTTTADLGEKIWVKGFNLGDGFIRMQDDVNGLTQLGVNTSLAANVAIDDLTIDNDSPRITGVTLVDASGNAMTTPVIYSRSNANKTLRLKFTTDKDITYDGVNSASSLRMRVSLNRFEPSDDTSNYYLYLDTDSKESRSFILELDVSNDVDDYIQDLNGLTLPDTYLSLTQGTIKSTDTGANLSRSIAGGVTTSIQNFDVSVDNKQPFIMGIAFDPNAQGVTANTMVDKCKDGFLCAGANAMVDLTVDFSEPVNFTSATQSHYTFKLVTDAGDLTLDATPVSVPGGFVTSAVFRFDVGDTGIAFNNGNFNLSLISNSLTLTGGAQLRDAAENSFTDTGLLLLTGTKNIEALAIDTNDPSVESADFAAGEYADEARVPLTLTFDKEVSITGAQDIVVTLDATTDATVDFTYTGGPKVSGNVTDDTAHVFDFTVDAAVDNNDYEGATHAVSFTATVTDFYGNQVTSTINLPTPALDSSVKIRPQQKATITSITVKRDNGTAVATLDNTNDYAVFGTDDKIIFEIKYSKSVDITPDVSADQFYLDFDIDSTTDDAHAIYASGLGTDTVKFELTVVQGYEDYDGITLANDELQIPGGSNLVVNGTTDNVSLNVGNAFVDKNHATAAKVLSNVRIETLAPEPPEKAYFVLGDTSWSTGSVTTSLRVEKGADRTGDTVKYRVLLYDGDSEATSNQYQLDVPTGVDYPGATSTVYATPDASGDVSLTIDEDMLGSGGNASCKLIYARVFAVDRNNQESTGVFSSEPAGDTSNDYSAFMRLEHRPTLNTKNANGDKTGDVVFGSVEEFPQIANTNDVTADHPCDNAELTYTFSISSDESGDLVTDKAIADYTTWADASEDALVPFREYTTQFRATDRLGFDATKDHAWTAYSKDLPIRYDLSDSGNLSLISGKVASVTNLGNGATVDESGDSEITKNPALWNLKPIQSQLADFGYTNVAPEYDATNDAVHFPISTTERANLFVDNDRQKAITDTYQNARVDIDHTKGVTIYMVVTPPGYNAEKGGIIADPTNDQTANGDYQSGFFIGTGGYYEDDSLESLDELDHGLAGALFKLKTREFANNSKAVSNLNMSALTTASRQLLVYQIPAETAGSQDFALKVYHNNQLVDDDTTKDLSFEYGLGFDKLYFGGIPYSASGEYDPAYNRLLGHNAGGMRLHEFMVYNDLHSDDSRGELNDYFKQKWNLVEDASKGMQIDVAAVFNQKNGAITKDGTSLTCTDGTSDNNIAFPTIAVTGIPDNPAYTHFLIEQNRAGDTAGNFGYMLLANLQPSGSTDVTLDATNMGGATFDYSFTAGSVTAIPATDAKVIKPFTGLCHQTGDNYYTYAVYTSSNAITAAAANDTIAEFEQAYANQLTLKAQKRILPLPTVPQQGFSAAYSLRKIGDGYTGAAIQVRESVGDTTKDIGFVSNGELDIAALETFVGSGNDGYITVWYDQSGNGRDLSQGTDNKQPQIVSSGSVLTRGGKPAIQFDGANDNLWAAESSLHNGHNNQSVFILADSTGSDDKDFFITYNGANQVTIFIETHGANNLRNVYAYNGSQDTNLYTTHGQFTGNQKLITFIATPTQYISRVDGANQQTGTRTKSGPDRDHKIVVGSLHDDTGRFYDGRMQEILLYDSDQSADMADIEANMDDYWK